MTREETFDVSTLEAGGFIYDVSAVRRGVSIRPFDVPPDDTEWDNKNSNDLMEYEFTQHSSASCFRTPSKVVALSPALTKWLEAENLFEEFFREVEKVGWHGGGDNLLVRTHKMALSDGEKSSLRSAQKNHADEGKEGLERALEENFDESFCARLKETLEASSAESEQPNSDFFMLLQFGQIRRNIHGNRVFTIDEWFALWDKHKHYTFDPLCIQDGVNLDMDGLQDMLEGIMREEFIAPSLMGEDEDSARGRIIVDAQQTFNFVDNDRKTLFDRSRESLDKRVSGIRATLRHYLDANVDTDYDAPMWASGPGKAYLKMLFARGQNPHLDLVCELLEKSAVERYSIVELGSHVMKSGRLVEIQEMVKSIIDSGARESFTTRIACERYGSLRKFNDRFLVTALGLPAAYPGEEEAKKYDEDTQRILRYMSRDWNQSVPLLTGSEMLREITRDRAVSSYKHEDIIIKKNDVNYVLAVLTNRIGLKNALIAFIDACENVEGTRPTMSQWKRYADSCAEDEDFAMLPIDIALSMSSRKRD